MVVKGMVEKQVGEEGDKKCMAEKVVVLTKV